LSYEKLTNFQSRIIIGNKQTLKAMKNSEVSEVFIATDADQDLTEKVVALARDLDLPCYRVNSMKKLGAACGIEVGTSTVAIRNISFGE